MTRKDSRSSKKKKKDRKKEPRRSSNGSKSERRSKKRPSEKLKPEKTSEKRSKHSRTKDSDSRRKKSRRDRRSPSPVSPKRPRYPGSPVSRHSPRVHSPTRPSGRPVRRRSPGRYQRRDSPTSSSRRSPSPPRRYRARSRRSRSPKRSSLGRDPSQRKRSKSSRKRSSSPRHSRSSRKKSKQSPSQTPEPESKPKEPETKPKLTKIEIDPNDLGSIMCPLMKRFGVCGRGAACSYAHSKEDIDANSKKAEMEAKSKQEQLRSPSPSYSPSRSRSPKSGETHRKTEGYNSDDTPELTEPSAISKRTSTPPMSPSRTDRTPSPSRASRTPSSSPRHSPRASRHAPRSILKNRANVSNSPSESDQQSTPLQLQDDANTQPSPDQDQSPQRDLSPTNADRSEAASEPTAAEGAAGPELEEKDSFDHVTSAPKPGTSTLLHPMMQEAAKVMESQPSMLQKALEFMNDDDDYDDHNDHHDTSGYRAVPPPRIGAAIPPPRTGAAIPPPRTGVMYPPQNYPHGARGHVLPEGHSPVHGPSSGMHGPGSGYRNAPTSHQYPGEGSSFDHGANPHTTPPRLEVVVMNCPPGTTPHSLGQFLDHALQDMLLDQRRLVDRVVPHRPEISSFIVSFYGTTVVQAAHSLDKAFFCGRQISVCDVGREDEYMEKEKQEGKPPPTEHRVPGQPAEFPLHPNSVLSSSSHPPQDRERERARRPRPKKWDLGPDQAPSQEYPHPPPQQISPSTQQASPESENKMYRIFVYNIPFDSTPEQVLDFFERELQLKFNSTEQCVEKVTPYQAGVMYITFKAARHLQAAESLNRAEFRGRFLSLRKYRDGHFPAQAERKSTYSGSFRPFEFRDDGCQLYFSNVPMDTRSPELRKFLNDYLHKFFFNDDSRPVDYVLEIFPPVAVKAKSFVTFTSIEAAQAALTLDLRGKFRGRTLYVESLKGNEAQLEEIRRITGGGRPEDEERAPSPPRSHTTSSSTSGEFHGTVTNSVIHRSEPVLSVFSSVSSEPKKENKKPGPSNGHSHSYPSSLSPYKVKLGNLPATIMASQLKAFINQQIQLLIPGSSKAANFVLSLVPDFRRGCATVNFESEELVLTALELDGVQFRNRRISVSSLYGAAASQSDRDQPTKVLCLLGVLTREELNHDKIYLSTRIDIENECQRYGDVIQIVAPRPGDHNYTGIPQIFVEFSSAADAFKAKAHLQRINMLGKAVGVEYWNYDKFLNEEFGL